MENDEDLHLAAQDGNLAEVERLLARGVDLNAFDELGKTALIYAADAGHMAVVARLLAAGADVNASDEAKNGNSALAEIAATCSLEMAKVLIDAGADPTKAGWMGITALDKAAKRKRGDGPKVHALFVAAIKCQR